MGKRGVEKRVRCIETGEIYPSICETERAFDRKGGVSCAINRGTMFCGYHWEFVDADGNRIERTPDNICWTCKNTNRYKCTWFDPDNQKEVPGWEVEKSVIRNYVSGVGIVEREGLTILSCPNFEMEVCAK